MRCEKSTLIGVDYCASQSQGTLNAERQRRVTGGADSNVLHAYQQLPHEENLKDEDRDVLRVVWFSVPQKGMPPMNGPPLYVLHSIIKQKFYLRFSAKEIYQE